MNIKNSDMMKLNELLKIVLEKMFYYTPNRGWDQRHKFLKTIYKYLCLHKIKFDEDGDIDIDCLPDKDGDYLVYYWDEFGKSNVKIAHFNSRYNEFSAIPNHPNFIIGWKELIKYEDYLGE